MSEVQGVEQPKIGAEHVRSCLIVLFIAMAVCTLPIWLPKILLIGNRIKWQIVAPSEYTIQVQAIGYVIWPNNLGSPVREGEQTNQSVSVDELFMLASDCIILCRVSYDAEYGYPTNITRGFIESGWLDISLTDITP